MILGPVFQAELLRTGRRRRYYVLRFIYGLLLLFIIWAGYEAELAGVSIVTVAPGGRVEVRGGSTVTIDQAARFAVNMFIRFSVVQLIAILLLIPALFGGVIADEKQRKTLHYLMASQLSSFEIVLDKVLARSAHLAVFLSLGLPVVCLLGLIGGVSPDYVAVAYAGTFSTASMAVGLTVLISTLSRRVRQSVLIGYVLLLAWQVVPFIVFGAGKSLWPATYDWIEPINTWVGATSPLYVYASTMMWTGMMRGPMSATAAIEAVAWMVGLQLGAATLMILLAVWRLRPTFRRHEATQPRRNWFGERKARRARAPRWWDRPECGVDAMAWKERYFARTDVFTKMVVLPATIFLSVVLVLRIGIDETILRALADLRHGQWAGGETLVEQMRVCSAWYVAIWLLAVAGASASSIAVEREEDTWTSLTSTPLTGWEIIRGKVAGALWAQRGFAMIPLGFWAFGLLVGSVHPLGFLGSVATLALVSWMVAAVGIHASLRATSTSKALASTMMTLAVLFGYPCFLLLSLSGYDIWDRYGSFVGMPTRLVVAPLMSYRAVGEAWSMGVNYFIAADRGINHSISPDVYGRLWGLCALVTYAAVAAGLTYRSVNRFDRWLDRPRMTDDEPAARKPAPVAEEVEAMVQS